jgi:hypothetical protein
MLAPCLRVVTFVVPVQESENDLARAIMHVSQTVEVEVLADIHGRSARCPSDAVPVRIRASFVFVYLQM